MMPWLTVCRGDAPLIVSIPQLACRGYMHETLGPVDEKIWPAAYDETYAAPMHAAFARILRACLAFARG